jgi:transcriptional regulator with XRE-family HTH domain
MEKRPRVKKQVAIKQHQKLPFIATVALNLTEDSQTRAAYVKALRMKGWTLQAIGGALGVSRERIRQVEATASPSLIVHILSNPGNFPVPELETKEVEVPGAPQYVEPSAATLTRLLELKPLAEKVRWDHQEHRAAAEEYTALLWHAHDVEKVTIYRLAKAVGVTHGAIRFRLARYGYLQPKTAKSKAYSPIKDKNRAVLL